MQEYPMTLEGKKLLDLELEKLIKIEREQVKHAIAEARAHGDLKENAEYHAAKEKQSYIEGAQPGMILNTVSQTLYDGDEGVLVIPCAFIPTYSEWSPMGDGARAPVKIYPGNSDILSKTKRDPKTFKDMIPNSGNYIQRDANHFVLIVDQY